MRRIVPTLLRIDAREVEFTRRGFACDRPQAREHLEQAGAMFLKGYHAALESDMDELHGALAGTALEWQGFAYEGAAMALALLDGLSLGKGGRFRRFAEGPGRRHIYMLHVGAGWAVARLPWLRHRVDQAIRRYHTLLRWLAVDGYGFHEGFFHGHGPAQKRINGARLSTPARHVSYQGLGRSLWFSCGASPQAIALAIAEMPNLYQSDAWSGAGLACAYAGGASREDIEDLQRRSGRYSVALAQGAAFAAKARQLAGNPTLHTETASQLLCGMTFSAAAALCDETLALVDAQHPMPYLQWRELIQQKIPVFSNNRLRGTSHEKSSVMAAPALH